MEYGCCLIALVTIVLPLVYYLLTKNYNYWKRNGIPCPGGIIPGLGHISPLVFMKQNIIDLSWDLYNEMPNVSMMGYYNLTEPALIVREPELVKTVMVKNFGSFVDNGLTLDKELDPLLAVNPFFVAGNIWKTSRQHLSAAFSSGKLKYMFGTVDEVCKEMKKYLFDLEREGNGSVELELKDLFSRFTSGVVAATAFGVEGNAFRINEDGPFRDIGRMMFEPSFTKGIIQHATLFFPYLGKILRTRFMPTKADRFFREVVKTSLKHRVEHGINRPDFLQLMLDYKEAAVKDAVNDAEFNDEIITSHAASFFFDGYETSSITLSFLGYEIAANPEVQQRLREEINETFAKHGRLSYEALQGMKYMDQVIYESMRLHPALGALLKQCSSEFELVGSDGIRCKLSPGTPVIIPVRGLHRDPKYWPNPEKFDPERFSEENKEDDRRFAYLPFGAGPRICVGMRMAMMQVKAAIATIFSEFSFEVSPRTKIPIQLDPHYFMSAAVGGLWVKVKRL